MIKVSTHKEDVMILNKCISNNRASKYMKQKLMKLKEETYTPTWEVHSNIYFGCTSGRIQEI